MTFSFPKKLLALLAIGVALALPARAITIRDDTSDSQYQALGNQAAYNAAGYFTGGFGGTLITDPLGLDEYVVTATHLVVGSSPLVAVDTLFTVGGKNYTVQSITSAPGYDSSDQENDLSIIRLANPVTGVAPIPYYTGSAELNNTITLIGYGVTGTGLTGANSYDGLKRGANNVIDLLNASALSSSLPSTSYLTDFDNPSGTSNSLGLVQTGGVANSSPTALTLEGSIASGDSGGGDFATIGGTLYLVGVHSYLTALSSNPDHSNPNGDYGDIDGSTRVSLFSSFITQNVPEPGSAALLLAGAAALGGMRRRRVV